MTKKAKIKSRTENGLRNRVRDRAAPKPTAGLPGISVEGVEIKLLLEAVFQRYGYDFRSYAVNSVRRRIWRRVHGESLATISGLLEKVLHDPNCMTRLLLDFSVHVSAFFRDPAFFRAVREKVVPLLRTCPFIRIWHAGCAGGEEVYSMAILMKEEGLYDRCRFYATDFNAAILADAVSGIFPLKKMKQHKQNYLTAGGIGDFSSYYTADSRNVIFKSSLKKNMVFSQHNLVTDGSFNEFNLILCRNVMIYFNRALQNQVHGLINDSLALSGILALGDKESLKFTPYEKNYQVLDSRNKIFRRTG